MLQSHSGRREMPLVGNFWCLELCLYVASNIIKQTNEGKVSEQISTNESGPLCP